MKQNNKERESPFYMKSPTVIDTRDLLLSQDKETILLDVTTNWTFKGKVLVSIEDLDKMNINWSLFEGMLDLDQYPDFDEHGFFQLNRVEVDYNKEEIKEGDMK